MEQVYIWVKDIFLIIISLTFFQILLPDSSMSKYLKFVFSMVVLVVIIEPILNLTENL